MTHIEGDDCREQVRLLVERTDGRGPLEALRADFARQVHRRSDDVDATNGLRLVTVKLQGWFGPALRDDVAEAADSTTAQRPSIADAATTLEPRWDGASLPCAPDRRRRDVLATGTRVAVRNRYQGSWSEGFEVVQLTVEGYRLRRESDRYLLPAAFDANDVRIGS